jgi:arabinogalactan oligomer/maltooligosaccharide transport system substrate-binding protein
MNESGKFTSVDDDYNSAKGIIAMKGMQIVTKSEYWVNSSSEFTNAGIVVTGIWNANTAVETLGENFGVTDLPSFTVGEETYHLASFSGNKLMGVKPQQDADKLAALHKLAQYLTNKECQLERYNEFQWGPSNLEAQQDSDVKANESLAALALQNENAIPQGNIHGSWWDIAKLLGGESKLANTDADIQAALDTYTATIAALFQKTDEELKAWSVIGTVNGTNWDTDLPMTEKSAGVYESAVYDFAAGNEFKCRQGGSWTVNFGADGKIDGANYVVETAGKYFVRLTIHSDTSATLELVPAN